MDHLPAPPAEARSSSRGRRVLPYGRATTRRVALAVETIGYLVPRTDFTGRVHSVFAQACNVACNDTLLTLCASSAGAGAATLQLAEGAADDLRDLFDVGERVDCHQGHVQTGRAELRLKHASVWRPAGPRCLLPAARIGTHLRNAGLHLAQRRRTHSSVIDREGAPVVAALRDACRALDREQAARQGDRLIGWGEGLTPAGDDFLVGLLAGLDALVHGDERRRRFRDAFAAALSSCANRTTPIAAHYLHLAAGGHYTEPLVCLRDALLAEDRSDVVDAALRRAFAIGATSGADTVTGLLAALVAWLPPASTSAAA